MRIIKIFSIISILIMLLQPSLSAPVDLETLFPTESLENESLVNGPLPDDIYCTTNNSVRVGSRSGKAEENYRWTKQFAVHPDPAFNKIEMKIITSALKELQRHIPCIKIKMWLQNSKPTGDYVFIEKRASGTGCYSLIGRQGRKQIIHLSSDRCLKKPAIIHECIHALGFDHEQNRPDRDKYVKIFWENINPGAAHNFEIAEGSLTFDVPYDYKSIMHYTSSAYSENGLPTILKKNGKKIQRNNEISSSDKLKLKRMYKC